MLASFVSVGFGLAGGVAVLLVTVVPMAVSAFRSSVDVDQLDPSNCHDCDT